MTPFLSVGRGVVAKTEDPWVSALAAALLSAVVLRAEKESPVNTVEMRSACPRGAAR